MPLLRAGLATGDALVDIRGVVPRGIAGGRDRRGHDARRARGDPQIPEVLREACRLAASPQLRNMGTLAGNLLQSTRCWYWRLDWPCRLHGGDECFAHEGEHREHAIFANDFCASAHPSDVAAALLALDATLRTNRRELPLAELYRVPTEDDRRTTTLEPGELMLALEFPDCRRVGVPEGDGAEALGVPARRRRRRARGDETRVALAGVAPMPWLLDERARRRDAAAAERVQGRDRRRRSSSAPERRSRRLDRASPGTRRGRCGRARRVRRGEAVRDDRGADDRRRTAAARSPRRRPRSAHGTKPTTPLDPAKTYDVTLHTNCGSFTIRLAVKTSPATTASFVSLVRERLLRRDDLPPDRPGLRHPGRRPDRQRHGRPRLHDRRHAAGEHDVHARRRRDGEDADRAARHERQPVLHRHGRRRRPAAGLRDARQRRRRLAGRATDRRSSATRRPSSRPRSSRSNARPSRSSDRRGGRARRRRRDPVRRPEAARAPARRARGPRRRRPCRRSSWSKEPGRSNDVRRGRGVTLVHCADWAHGPGASLRCGLARARRRRSTQRSSCSPTARSSTRGPCPASSSAAGDAPVVAASYDGAREPPGAARARRLVDRAGRGRPRARARAGRLLRPAPARRRRLPGLAAQVS